MKHVLLTVFLSLAMSASAIRYVNPILPYDYSDPDVCRVGDEYLMTSSSFNNIPGLQILESKDLVHWQIVDAALPYRVPGYEPGCKVLGNFAWAPSIRVHGDTLYIYYGDPDRGVYALRAGLKGLSGLKGLNSSNGSSSSKLIVQGSKGLRFPLKWEEPVLVMAAKGYIDPCPLWDEDGRCYLVHGIAGSRRGVKSVLLMAELTSDGLSVKTPSRIIYDGHEENPTCEGPKLYKKDGYYYIFHPAGGVEFGWQVVQRSKNIYGPYEWKTTLQQGKTDINGPHQGAWVEDTEGGNWFFHFRDVGVAGRIVYLEPVEWKEGWPIMGSRGEPVSGYEVSGSSSSNGLSGLKSSKGLNGLSGLKSSKSSKSSKDLSWGNFARRDEFDSTALALDWQWAGGYVNPTWYYCDSQNSRLRLYSYPEGEELMENMLLQKIPYAAFTATARVRFTPNTNPKLQGKEEAGLIVFGKKSFRLPVSESGKWVYLRLVMDEKQKGQFYIGEDGENWTPFGEEFQAVEGKWIGAQVGLYCTREDRKINDSGYLDVDWFEVSLP